MASPSSTCVDLTLRAVKLIRRRFGPASLLEEVERKASKPSDPSPRFVGKGVAIEETALQGVRTYRLSPAAPSGTHVLYLHGGSYTFEISPIHWWALGRLVRDSRATFVVPIYPLAPSSTADATVASMTAIATELAAAHPGLVVAGDSAGGGMALAVAEQLVAAGITSVRRVALLSPWLDVTMTDPAMEPLVAKDLMLTREDLRDAGGLYAGALDPRDPRVSPLHGELAGLPPLTVFCGTHDILLADARALRERAEAAGVPVDLQEVPGAQHAYPLLPTREGKAARAHLVRALTG